MKFLFLGAASFFLLITGRPALADPSGPPIRIGWIGAMTGPVSKYAAHQSATLAMEHINQDGGIGGRPLELVFQDGKCQAKDAIDAANSLIERGRIRFIIGGHCSTESLAIAPIVERSGSLMMAASSSSPKLSAAGDHIFRMTAPNVRGIELLVPFILSKRSERSFVVVYEETEYAQGMAETFQQLLGEKGGKVLQSLAYKMGEGDFLSFVTRIKAAHADAVYLSVQSPDSAILFMQKARQLGLSLPVFGNEITGNSVLSASSDQAANFDGVVFAEPSLGDQDEQSKRFIKEYKTRFKVDKLPNGFWSAEAYDAVQVLAGAIAKCGDDVEKVKRCLYDSPGYQGASGSVSFDRNGDGVRRYALKVVDHGQLREIH